MVDIVRGRLVGRGVQIIGLRIGAVAAIDNGIGGQQRLFVDDIDGKFRAGKAVFGAEIVDIHVSEGLALLPGRIQPVIGRGIARSLAPDHAVAHIAELPRRIDDRRHGDICHDQYAVVELFVGVYRLVDPHGDRCSVHFGIPIVLRTEAGVHKGDIIERVVHIGRGTVVRHRLGYGDKPLLHHIAFGLGKKQRINAKNAAADKHGSHNARKRLFKAEMRFDFQCSAPALFADGARMTIVHDFVQPVGTFFEMFHDLPCRRASSRSTVFSSALLQCNTLL